jgi:uncharacterized Ntn-hydrolase superfamily protein
MRIKPSLWVTVPVLFMLPAAAALVDMPARATYSIVAADSASGQVGGSGTSCVGSALDVFIIYGGAPGHGAVHAQARVSTAGRDEAVRLLELDTLPDDIIAAITAPAFDRSASQRQYGIADLAGRAAGFTGSSTLPWSGDLQGTDGAFAYSIQGNILTSGAVLDQAEEGFLAGGCDLADRLMLALEAGAENGEGDSRCTPDGIPSDGAFLHVDLSGGEELVHLEANDTRPESPLVELRGLYDAWRLDHPCPAPPEPEPEAEEPEPLDEDLEPAVESDAFVEPADMAEETLPADASADEGPSMDAAGDDAGAADADDDVEGGEAGSGCGCALAR